MRKSQRFRKPHRFKRKRSILKSRSFWLSVLALIIFLAVFYLISFSSIFQVKEIEISGNQKVPTEDIKGLVKDTLPRRILFFDSGSILLIDLRRTREELLDKLPQIKKVEFDRDFLSKLIVSIEERKPVAIVENGEKDLFIDDQGIAFEEVSERGSWLLIKDPNQSQDLKLGEKVVEEEKLSPILEIKSELRELGIRISLAEVIGQHRVDIETLEGWKIYFDLESDISKQVFNLDLVLKEKISLEKRENLEYVDLRFGNQIYYK